MNLQYTLAPDLARPVHQNRAIKAAWPEQSRIQNLGTVGCRHEDDAHLWIKTIHFHQQLIEGLLPFIMPPDGIDAAGLAECVKFVNEDDAGRLLFGLHKKVSHPRRPQADEHLDKLR